MNLFDYSFFKKLKEIIKVYININKLINIQYIHIDLRPSSKQLEYDEDTKRLSLNYKEFPYMEKNKIKEILREAQNEGATLLVNESQERIKDIKSKEEEPDTKSLLNFFKDKLPNDDYLALRAAIYIDKLAREHLDYKQVYRLKWETANRFGPRAYKICNLYALGYFETEIKPLYEEFYQDGFFDRKKFLNKYNTIINEEAFAIFVPDTMEKDEVDTIKLKIARNLKYGRRDVTIHGKGRYNVAKVRGAISDIEEEGEYPIIKMDIEETGNNITSKLWF